MLVDDPNDVIHIALAFHDPTGSYTMHAGVTLASVFSNTKQSVCAYILHDKTLTTENRQNFESLAAKFHKKVQFIEVVSPNFWESICIRNKNAKLMTKGVFYRLLLPEILLRIDKIIYLDCDVIVDMDIKELWELNLEGKPIAAKSYWSKKEYNQYLFNSGVMILSLNMLRKKYSILNSMVQFFNLFPDAQAPDQDFLNWLTQGNFLNLESKYNILVNVEDVEKFPSGHRILHFGGEKPWNDYVGSCSFEYWKYALLTPWAEDVPDNLYKMGLNTKKKFNQLQIDLKNIQENCDNQLASHDILVTNLFNAALGEKIKSLTTFIAQITQQRVVQGPFKGMFIGIDSSWGAGDICPKLLGTYEKELHPVFEEVTQSTYQWVLDIGCAEGYYAVGLALTIPTANVIAFDTDDRARQICLAAAVANDVRGRIQVAPNCTLKLLKNVIEMTTKDGNRCLIKMDVEGYEYELLFPEVIPKLKLCDIIVECHDFRRGGLTQTLMQRLSLSHDIHMIHQVERTPITGPFLAHLSALDRWLVVNEGRLEANHWLFCKAIHFLSCRKPSPQ